MAFVDARVEVAGSTVRYRESGTGPALVHLAGGALSPLTPAHELLARRFRVIAVEAPATLPLPALAGLATVLGVEGGGLWATASGVQIALALAREAPERVRSLLLEAPDAVRPDAALARLAVPTLVVVGTRDDAAVAERGRGYKDLMPNAHLVFVYDAGHAVASDRPEAFAEVAGDFLERHEAFVISRAATVIHP